MPLWLLFFLFILIIIFIFPICLFYPISFSLDARTRACFVSGARILWSTTISRVALCAEIIVISIFSGFHRRVCRLSCADCPWSLKLDAWYLRWSVGQALGALWQTCHINVALRLFRSRIPLSSRVQRGQIWEGSVSTCAAFWCADVTGNLSVVCGSSSVCSATCISRSASIIGRVAAALSILLLPHAWGILGGGSWRDFVYCAVWPLWFWHITPTRLWNSILVSIVFGIASWRFGVCIFISFFGVACTGTNTSISGDSFVSSVKKGIKCRFFRACIAILNNTMFLSCHAIVAMTWTLAFGLIAVLRRLIVVAVSCHGTLSTLTGHW